MNRELMGNIISQQCAFYKYKLKETIVNLYGEASGGKTFDGPVLLNALITIGDNVSPTSDLGVNFDWPMSFAFLRDDLVDSNVHPEIGDVIVKDNTPGIVDLKSVVPEFKEEYCVVLNNLDTVIVIQLLTLPVLLKLI